MVRYRIHPSHLEVEEGERYYERMAAKGWMLTRRGSDFSRFEREVPQDISCRIVLVGGASLDSHNITDEQMDILKESGWELKAQNGMAFVFMGPPGAEFPEAVIHEEQREKTLRSLRRSNIFGIAVLILYFGVLFAAAGAGRPGGITDSLSRLVCMLLEKPILTLSMCTALVALPVNAMIELWDGGKLYRAMKAGRETNRKPRRWWKFPPALVIWSLILSIALTIVGMIPGKKQTLPEMPQEPYLVLADLGIHGERVTSSIGGECAVYHERSLLAEHWDSREFVNTGSGEEYLYQDAYDLRLPSMAGSLIRSLMNSSLFGRSEDRFTQVDVPGLDCAYYYGSLECIAARDDKVLMVTGNFDSEEELLTVLYAAAEKWSE